jgi:hypothetical protein
MSLYIHPKDTSTPTTTISSHMFIRLLQNIHSSTSENLPKESPLLFRFEFTKEAALHNAIILEQFNYDITQAIHKLCSDPNLENHQN